MGHRPGAAEEDDFGGRPSAGAGGRRAATPEAAEPAGERPEETPQHPRKSGFPLI